MSFLSSASSSSSFQATPTFGNQTLDERIQSSDNFRRITEANQKMKKERKAKKKKLLVDSENEKNGLKYLKKEEWEGKNDNHMNEVFTAHTLNKDPEVAKYLLFNEIIYPKLFTKTNNSQFHSHFNPNDDKAKEEEINKLWVNGFLDRSIRDKDKVIPSLRAGKLKPISSFLRQNDDSISVNSSSASATSAASSSHANSSVGKTTSEGGGKTITSNKSKDSKFKFDPSVDLPSPSPKKSHRSDELQALEAFKAPSFEPDDATSSLSVNDKYRLKLLTNSIKNHQKMKKETSRTLLQSLKVYETQNRVMKQASLPSKGPTPAIHSLELDYIFEKERIENIAVKKIQKAYVHSCLIAKLRYVFRCMVMAVRIQKHIRGNLTRKRVAEWFAKKTSLMIQWQCRVRRALSNTHLRHTLQHEKQAIIKIQSMIRRKLAKIHLLKFKRTLAATRIQCLWRGVCARIRSDRLWLNKIVIPIQVLIRKMVSRMRYESIKTERINAAVTIQRCFRSWLSIQKLSTSLNGREDIYREYTLAMLTAEEEWADDTIVKLSHRLEKKEVREKLEIVIKDYQKTIEEIHFKENDHIELSRQRDILSARAIQQGWLSELDGNISVIRNEMTSLKMKLIFKKHVLLNSLETQLTTKVKEIESIARIREKISDYRDQEIEDNRVRDFYRNTTKLRKNKRQAIAHERRKWMVHFYTPNGKPDKLRRPGRKWDPEAYAGPEKMTYCSASGVDLFALNKVKTKGTKEGSNESVEQKINEVSLQTYLQQMNEYETLLNPLYAIMQTSLGGGDGSESGGNDTGGKRREGKSRGGGGDGQPLNGGLGPIGELLPTALEGIDAIPKEWKSQREENKKKELRKQRELERKKRIQAEEEYLLQRERDLLLQQTDGLSQFNEFFDHDGEGDGGEGEDGASLSSQTISSKGSSLSHLGSKKQSSSSSTNHPSRALKDLSHPSSSLSPSRHSQTSPSPSLQSQTHKPLSNNEIIKQEKRKKRNHDRARGAVAIPWALLDELDGEKKKFEGEKSYLEFYHKF